MIPDCCKPFTETDGNTLFSNCHIRHTKGVFKGYNGSQWNKASCPTAELARSIPN
jgi:hypothetical protein